MKKLFLIPILGLLFLAATWTHAPEKERWNNGKQSLRYEATFAAQATLSSSQTAIVGKSFDVSWTTYPFVVFYNIDLADTIASVTVKAVYWGVIGGSSFRVDSTSVTTAVDIAAYTTTDLGNLKFPEYKVTLAADSCTVILVLF